MVTYAVLCIYCCLKFYPKLSILKQQQHLLYWTVCGSGIESGLPRWFWIRISRDDILGHQSLGHKTIWLLRGCLLDHLLWGKAAYLRTPHQHYGEVCVARA